MGFGTVILPPAEVDVAVAVAKGAECIRSEGAGGKPHDPKET